MKNLISLVNLDIHYTFFIDIPIDCSRYILYHRTPIIILFYILNDSNTYHYKFQRNKDSSKNYLSMLYIEYNIYGCFYNFS